MHHGSSPAAWTAVILALVGFTLGGIALIPSPNWIFFTIACVLTAIAGPVGIIMAKAGYGIDAAKDH